MKTALILAGGKGKRLWPVTKGAQKVIVNIGDKPFIKIIIDKLLAEKFNEIYIATGYKSKEVKTYIDTLNLNHIIRVIEEDMPLGTGGAILNALFKIKNDKLVVLNGDTYNDITYSSLLSIHDQNKCDISILSKLVNDISRYGEIITNKDNRILKFIEKKGDKRPGVINVGAYVLYKNIFSEETHKVFSFEDFLSKNVLKLKIFSVPSSGEFVDIGIPEDLLKFKNKIIKSY